MVSTKRVVGTNLATKTTVRVTRKGCPNHPIDFKRRLAAQACVPGVSVARLALEHGINTNLLFTWRRHYRAGKFGVPDPAHAAIAASARESGTIAPVRVPPMKLLPVVATMAAADRGPASCRAQPAIEILLGNATVRVHGAVDRVALRTVLDCLARRS